MILYEHTPLRSSLTGHHLTPSVGIPRENVELIYCDVSPLTDSKSGQSKLTDPPRLFKLYFQRFVCKLGVVRLLKLQRLLNRITVRLNHSS